MSGRSYSMKEKRDILQYIIDENAYGQVKGNKLWKEMECKIPGRSWQSLKEHFKKQLYPRLHQPVFDLTLDERNLFIEGFHRSVLKYSSKRNAKDILGKSESPEDDVRVEHIQIESSRGRMEFEKVFVYELDDDSYLDESTNESEENEWMFMDIKFCEDELPNGIYMNNAQSV